MKMPTPAKRMWSIYIPEGLSEVNRKQKPAHDSTLGAIQNVYPFHIHLSLAPNILNFSLLKKRPAILTKAVTKIKSKKKLSSPEQLIANLFVSPRLAK